MTNEDQALAVIDEPVSVPAIKTQMEQIQKIMKGVLVEGEHYGKIPGCGKKLTLFKSGAEKLCFAFNLRHEFHVSVIDELDSDHQSVRVTCKIFNKGTGLEVGQGVGAATTKETKWRYRKDSTENNPADYYNTVLKMAKKRAMVDATITATACSDIFTQDIEDLESNKASQADTSQSSPTPPVNTDDPPTSSQSSPSSQEGQKPPAKGNTVTSQQAKAIYAMFMSAGFNIPQMKEYLEYHYQEPSNFKLSTVVLDVIKGLADKGELKPLVAA